MLTVVQIAMPIASSATSFTKSDTLKSIFEKIDFSVFLGFENETEDGTADIDGEIQDQIKDEAEEKGFSSEVIEKILKTDAARELFDLVAEDISAAMRGDVSESKITVDAIKDIVKNNVDEIANTVYEFLPADEKTSLEEFKTTIIEESNSFAPEIAEGLADIKVSFAEDMGKEIFDILKIFSSGIICVFFWVAVVILSALIYLCRFPRFKGFMWLGAVYMFSALCSFIMFLTLENLLFGILSQEMGENIGFVSPLFDVFVSQYGITSLIFFATAVVMIGAFVAGRIWLNKRKTSADCEALQPMGFVPPTPQAAVLQPESTQAPENTENTSQQ